MQKGSTQNGLDSTKFRTEAVGKHTKPNVNVKIILEELWTF